MTLAAAGWLAGWLLQVGCCGLAGCCWLLLAGWLLWAGCCGPGVHLALLLAVVVQSGTRLVGAGPLSCSVFSGAKCLTRELLIGRFLSVYIMLL